MRVIYPGFYPCTNWAETSPQTSELVPKKFWPGL